MLINFMVNIVGEKINYLVYVYKRNRLLRHLVWASRDLLVFLFLLKSIINIFLS